MPLVGRFLGFMADRPLPADPYLVHKEPFTFYLVKLPIFFLPWTLFVPGALWHWFKRTSPAASPLATLLRCALVAIAIVLQAASAKVACYALPLYPILFLMVGVWCEDLLSAAHDRFSTWMSRATSALLSPVLFVVPCAYLLLFAFPNTVDRLLDRWSASLGEASTWLWAPGAGVAWLGAGLSAGALFCAVLGLRWVRAANIAGDRAGATLRLVAVSMVVMMLTSGAVIPAWDFQRTYQPMAELARAEIAAGRHVALAVGQEKDVGEFNFYTDARLLEVSLIPGVREFLEQGREPRGVVVHAEDVDALAPSLVGLDHEIREVKCPAGLKSKRFRLVTRG
jgi:4-amino-4-deoxy-L-arabinose transferase-like glycosyltransferase